MEQFKYRPGMTKEEMSEVIRQLDIKINAILEQLDPVFVEMLTTNPTRHETLFTHEDIHKAIKCLQLLDSPLAINFIRQPLSLTRTVNTVANMYLAGDRTAFKYVTDDAKKLIRFLIEKSETKIVADIVDPDILEDVLTLPDYCLN